MLGKLLKNDFIQTGRIFLWLLGGGIVGGGIGALVTMNQDIGAGQFVLAMFWNSLLMLAAFALQLLSLVIILVSTNRALFTERGYLTFALPVSTTQMLLSKFISNVSFMLLSMAEMGGIVYVAFLNIRRLAQNVGDVILDQMGMGGDEFREQLIPEIGLPSFGEVLQFAGFLMAVILVLMVLLMMIALFVLTISHVRPFHTVPALWIPVFLGGVTWFCFWADRLICKYFGLNVTLRFRGMLASEGGIPLNLVHGFVWLGFSLALFAVTDYLMSRKISLK